MINDTLDRSFRTNKDLEKLLKDKLKSTGLSKTNFERLSGIQRKSLDRILKKSSKQTDILNLLKLGEFLELNLEDLFILHFNNRPIEEIKDLQNSMDITYINKNFDLKTFASLGFININDNVEKLSERICEFFELDSIYDYEKDLNDALYSRTKKIVH